MNDKVTQTETPREAVAILAGWRLEDRRIYAVNAYRVDWFHVWANRESALADFEAVLRKASDDFYGPHGDHRLVLVDEDSR